MGRFSQMPGSSRAELVAEGALMVAEALVGGSRLGCDAAEKARAWLPAVEMADGLLGGGGRNVHWGGGRRKEGAL